MAGPVSTSSSEQAASKAALPFSDTEFRTVVVTSYEGDVYQLPNVGVSSVRKVVPSSGRIPEGGPTSLTLMNMRAAVLMVPYILIAKVQLGDEVLWERKAP